MENLSFRSHQSGWQTGVVILTFLYLLAFHVGPTTAADQVVNCSKSKSDCIPGVSWFDSNMCSCQVCSKCNNGGNEMFVKQQCNVSQNAVCACHSPLYYDSGERRCVIDCYECATKKCVRHTESCECPKTDGENCYQEHDLYCRNGPVLCQELPTELSTEVFVGVINPRETSLPPWGIGLIAIGVVIGIIIFASCFLCLGIFTVTKNKDAESQGSDSSESTFVMRGSITSVGTESSFISTGYPYLNNRNMLELLKNSNTQFLLQTSNGGINRGATGGWCVKLDKQSCVHNNKMPRAATNQNYQTGEKLSKLSAVVL